MSLSHDDVSYEWTLKARLTYGIVDVLSVLSKTPKFNKRHPELRRMKITCSVVAEKSKLISPAYRFLPLDTG